MGSPPGHSENQDLSVVVPTKNQDTSPLPPVSHHNDNVSPLSVTKKRKLQPPNHLKSKSELKRLPSKSNSRSASSASSEKRVPSLGDIHKPGLSPPAPDNSYKSFEESPNTIRNTSTPAISHTLSSPSKVQSQRTPVAELKELKRKETDLESRLRRERARLETLKRAKTILAKGESETNNKLVEQWREAAQRASNYMLNAAIDKVSKTGGKKEFVRREKEKLRDTMEYNIDNSFQDRIGEITRSEVYERLPEEEKERVIQQLEDEQEGALKEVEKSFMANEDDDEDEDFTMKDLYKRLKLDYKLVYPEETD